MTVEQLIQRLEADGYGFLKEIQNHDDDVIALHGVDPTGRIVEINHFGNLTVDRVIGTRFWDILYIDGGDSE